MGESEERVAYSDVALEGYRNSCKDASFKKYEQLKLWKQLTLATSHAYMGKWESIRNCVDKTWKRG